MTTGDVVYSLRFSLIKILPEPGFDLGSTAGESCVLTARLHMLYLNIYSFQTKFRTKKFVTTCYSVLHTALETINITLKILLNSDVRELINFTNFPLETHIYV